MVTKLTEKIRSQLRRKTDVNSLIPALAAGEAAFEGLQDFRNGNPAEAVPKLMCAIAMLETAHKERPDSDILWEAAGLAMKVVRCYMDLLEEELLKAYPSAGKLAILFQEAMAVNDRASKLMTSATDCQREANP